MKTPLLFFLIVAFLTFFDRKNRETNQSSADNLNVQAFSCAQNGVIYDAHPAVDDLLLQTEHPFHDFKLFVHKYFIPEDMGLGNTGVILYYLENMESEAMKANEGYTRGITLISECFGALSLEFSYDPEEKDVQLKADVSNAYGSTEHLLDCSININPCTAEPIAALLATIKNTFTKQKCTV